MALREDVRDWLVAVAVGEDGNPLPVAEIAERAGLSRMTVYRILRAEEDTSLDTLAQVASAFAVPAPGLRLAAEGVPAATPQTIIAGAIAALEQAARAISGEDAPTQERDPESAMGALDAVQAAKKGRAARGKGGRSEEGR